MRISQVKVKNFKAFNGEHVFDIVGGMVFLVGENNTGKSSLFEAINFIKSGLPKEKNSLMLRIDLPLKLITWFVH
jgi:AAA15 family ATPase/GTPase